MKVGAGVEVGNHAARGGHGHVEKAIFAGDAPDRDETAHDDAAIEEVAVVLADAGGRGMFEGERLQAVVPGVVAEKRRGQPGAVENLFISRYVVEKDERAGRVPGDFGGNRLVFLKVRAVETGDATSRILNAGVEKPVSGPRERICSRQSVSLTLHASDVGPFGVRRC